MAKYYASRNGMCSEREQRNMERVRRIASQGMVLLENDGVLPVTDTGKKIALYGNGARHTVKGGTGSGDVNSRTVVTIEEGLQAAGYTIVTKKWLDEYDRIVEEAHDGYIKMLKEQTKDAENPPMAAMLLALSVQYKAPPIPRIKEADLADTDLAVFVISRNSGEGSDRFDQAGDYQLYAEERSALEFVASAYDKCVVVLNVGGVMDTQWIKEIPGIDAVLLMSQAGNIGGYALADVISGAVTPSGKLTATWAVNYSDYPFAQEFSHNDGNVDDAYYREGIYVGYRYFDTFGIAPAYPFGYGLSYTTFCIEPVDVEADEKLVTVTVQVTNTGSTYAGKEVVQVYYSAPAGSLEKPYQELAAYAKTRLLAPGESQTLKLTYLTKSMASYCENCASWVLEAGEYVVRVGNSSRHTKAIGVLVLDTTAPVERLSNRFPLDCELEQLSKADAVPYTYAGEAQEIAAAKVILLSGAKIPCAVAQYETERPSFVCDREEKLTMKDVFAGTATIEELTAQLTVEELATLCVGAPNAMTGEQSVIGAASGTVPGAAGDTTSILLENRNVENMIFADGPAGLRLQKEFLTTPEGELIQTQVLPMPGLEKLMEGVKLPGSQPGPDSIHYYQYCTAIPIAMLLAMTWDLELIQECGDIVGEEMETFNVTLWLAPGMNIHRNPMCGRNFEYYSEDPLVSGLCAAADTRGVQAHAGIGTTIKHFAANNQEDNRLYSNSHVSERALREIYLKGFEICVKSSQPMSVMSSYNLLNGIHTANNYDLLTAVLREEWGFAGMVMTDWGTTGTVFQDGISRKYKDASPAGCIKAGNELIMPGAQSDIDGILQAVGSTDTETAHPLTIEELRCAASHILKLIGRTNCYQGAIPYGEWFEELEEYVIVEYGANMQR